MVASDGLTFLHPQVEVRPQDSVKHGEPLLFHSEGFPALVFQSPPHLPMVENSDVENRGVEMATLKNSYVGDILETLKNAALKIDTLKIAP